MYNKLLQRKGVGPYGAPYCLIHCFVLNKALFTRCRHILKTARNVTDRPPVHTKTAHFLPADFENGRFENGTLTGTFWKRHRANTLKFFWFRHTSFASKSCNELFTGKFPTVFKLFWHRVNASSNFATVTFFIVFKMCRHRVNAVLLYFFIYQ